MVQLRTHNQPDEYNSHNVSKFIWMNKHISNITKQSKDPSNQMIENTLKATNQNVELNYFVSKPLQKNIQLNSELLGQVNC